LFCHVSVSDSEDYESQENNDVESKLASIIGKWFHWITFGGLSLLVPKVWENPIILDYKTN